MTLLTPETLDVTVLPSLPLERRKSLPHVAALYFVLDAANAVLYIGQTLSMCGRWAWHDKLGVFADFSSLRIAWLAIDEPEQLKTFESQCIVFFQPSLNRRGKQPLEVMLALRATTLRVDPVLLRKARLLLDEEGKSINEFLVEQLEQYVKGREQAQTKKRATKPSP